MNRTRAVAAVAASASLLLVSACASAPADEAAPEAGSDYLACMVANSGNIEDRSFNQAVHESLEAAKAEYGIDTRETVSLSSADYETNLASMVTEGCDYIVTVGWELAEATQASAAANPDITYSIVDERLEGENIRSIVHDTAQASYLAGYLAAAQSESGIVGTFGGGNQPPVTVFMDGFADGVARFNEERGEDVRVVGWDKEAQQGSFTDDFTNTNTAKTVAEGLIAQGADIIMPVAAQAGEGAAAAALEAGDVGLVWVDSDGYETLAEQFRPLVLTTVEKHMQPAILEVIGSELDGTFQAGPYIGTLANDGVGLADFHDWSDRVSPETRAALDDLAAKIESGEIVVSSASSPTA